MAWWRCFSCDGRVARRRRVLSREWKCRGAVENVAVENVPWRNNQKRFPARDLLFTLGFFDNPLVLPLPCWSLAFQGFVPLKMFGWLIWKIGKSVNIGEIGISWNWSYSTAMAMGPYGRDGVKKKRQIKWRWLVNSKMDTYKDISQTHGSLSSRPLCSGTMSSPPNQPRHQPSENQSLWFGDKYLSSDYLVTTSLARVCTGALGRGGSP